jgi:hypothetical protein
MTNLRLRATAAWTGTAAVVLVTTVNPIELYAAGLNLSPSDGDIGIAAHATTAYLGDPSQWTQKTLGDVSVDPENNLGVRGTILTDENSFSDHFTGSGLTAALTGTLSFTNGSTRVTGVGTKFLSELTAFSYIKKTADAETAYALVLNVIDDLTLDITTSYTGTTAATTGVKSNWVTLTGTGGTISVGTSVLTIASGTTNPSTSGVSSRMDYMPLAGHWEASISQRIANQVGVLGFQDTVTSPNVRAAFIFDGATNTTVKCQTMSASGANDTQTVTVTLPSGNTSTPHLYELYIRQSFVVFFIDGVLVATLQANMPGPYTVLQQVITITNSGAVTTTSLVIDMAEVENFDSVSVWARNAIPALLQGQMQGPVPVGRAAAAVNPLVIGGSDGTNVQVAGVDGAGRLKTSGGNDSTAAALANVAGSASSVTLQAANTARKGLTIVNDSTATLYVKCGSTASATSYTVRLFANDYWECPFGYTGIVTGIWGSATGSARMTEFT